MAHRTPHLTLYFLQASRSIRVAWLLEELGIPYTLRATDRENQKAPQAFKDEAGGPLGKFPCLRDALPTGLGQGEGGGQSENDIVVHESGAIVEYVLDNYDSTGRLMPDAKTHAYKRAQVQTFVHGAEGALMLHALAIMYFRWHLPADFKNSEEGQRVMAETEGRMAVNVRNDLAWVERELGSSSGMFLVGNEVTAADVMMHFSVEFTVERELGVRKEEFPEQYPRLEAWLQRCRQMESYRRAVEKTGYTLYPGK